MLEVKKWFPTLFLVKFLVSPKKNKKTKFLHFSSLKVFFYYLFFFIFFIGFLTVSKSVFYSPETLRGLPPLAPFWCFLSGGEGGTIGLLSNRDGDVEGEGAGRFSKGDRDGLGRLSISDGGVVERGVPGPRPFRNFSWILWDAGDVEEDLRGADDGEEDEEEKEREELAVGDEELTLMCAPSDLLKHGIFSRLTTGKDTLENNRLCI